MKEREFLRFFVRALLRTVWIYLAIASTFVTFLPLPPGWRKAIPFGIAGLFNSVLLDRYFRVLSGNTQVNATELRTLNFPDMNVVRKIGRGIRRLNKPSAVEVERVVLAALGINDSLGKLLLEAARG